MNKRNTNILHIVITISLYAAVVFLYFLYAGSPPVNSIKLRTLLSILLGSSISIHLLTLYSVKQNEGDIYRNIFLVFGLFQVLCIFISDAIQLGSLFSYGKAIDPTLTGYHTESTFLLFGPLSRLLNGICLLGIFLYFKYSLPFLFKVIILIVIVLQFLLIFSIFGSTNPTIFHSINGWNIPIGGGWYLFVLLWTVYYVHKKWTNKTL